LLTKRIGGPSVAAAPAGGNSNTTTVVRALFAAYSASNRKLFMTLLASDAVQTEASTSSVYRGAVEIATNFWASRATFPNVQVTLTGCFASGDQAVAQLIHQGAYETSAYGRSATLTTWYVCHVLRLRHSAIIEINTYTDRLSMLDQLSAPPASPAVHRTNGQGLVYEQVQPAVYGPWSEKMERRYASMFPHNARLVAAMVAQAKALYCANKGTTRL
jgi:ketosteroid isomerase-like protein